MFVVSSSFPHSGVRKRKDLTRKLPLFLWLKQPISVVVFFTVTIFYEATSIAPIETNG